MINRCHVTSVEEAEENVGGAVVKHLRSRSQPHMGKWGAELQRDQSRRYWREMKSWKIGGHIMSGVLAIVQSLSFILGS